MDTYTYNYSTGVVNFVFYTISGDTDGTTWISNSTDNTIAYFNQVTTNDVDTGVLTNVLTEVESDTNHLTQTGIVDRVVYWTYTFTNGASVGAGASSASHYEYIDGYAYTGGEAEVTISWTQHYSMVRFIGSGDMTVTGNTGGSIEYVLRFNGITNNYTAETEADTYADVYPETANNYAITDWMAFLTVKDEDDAFYLYGDAMFHFDMECFNTYGGIQCWWRGHGWNGSSGDETLIGVGSVQNLDSSGYEGEYNWITQAIFSLALESTEQGWTWATNYHRIDAWGLRRE